MRVRRKSIGGISDTSADVHTTTPGNVSAALVSIDMMRPCAWAERTRRMCNMWGKATSAAKAPRPVTNGRSSRRVTERPTKLMSDLTLRPLSWFVMRGQKRVEDARERAYAPRIHRKEALQSKRMDCRVKPGNDDSRVFASDHTCCCSHRRRAAPHGCAAASPETRRWRRRT